MGKNQIRLEKRTVMILERASKGTYHVQELHNYNRK
jgi:hypothetical protein